MEPYFSHYMFLWTKNLTPVERINLDDFSISALLSLRGVKVDWDFLRSCLKFWDTTAHVFRLGPSIEEICPTFEEFCAILGSDPNPFCLLRSLRWAIFRRSIDSWIWTRLLPVLW